LSGNRDPDDDDEDADGYEIVTDAVDKVKNISIHFVTLFVLHYYFNSCERSSKLCDQVRSGGEVGLRKWIYGLTQRSRLLRIRG
jgi:hypothetical protein